AWDYCAQYRETDFAFLSRLMEAEGIYYYFQHENGNHVMVLADAPSCYSDLPVQSSFKYSPVTGVEALEDTIRTWSLEERIHSGKWTMRDYHHEMPTSTLESTDSSASVADEGKKFEVYDYPGGYAKKFNEPSSRLGDIRPEGDDLAVEYMQGREVVRLTATATSRCRAFASGYKIKVTGGDAAGSYLLTTISHWASQRPPYRTSDNAASGYENEFTCIDAATVFKTAAQTPKPVVPGLQTALIVDESSGGNTEEIWPDKYGRVRARFNWDRDAKYACWLRVVQPWAGKSWGHLWLPRVGDEVAVSFLEGDPDCPVVVGSIYNSDNMPVFAQPDNKTQSGILTRSSPQGGSANFNMLRFEDKKGSEEINIQAEKDWNSLIKNNETRTVKNDRATTIHVNDSRTVETGDDTLQVQQGKRTITVMGNIAETCKQGNISTEASMGNISVKADIGNISDTASLGSITIEASVGKVTISGLEGIQLTCGASSIQMTPASISISAPMVLINS
ncbi:MAG: type VI secretion system Vgr family protein, partial [Bryobacteraceae bacterium]